MKLVCNYVFICFKLQLFCTRAPGREVREGSSDSREGRSEAAFRIGVGYRALIGTGGLSIELPGRLFCGGRMRVKTGGYETTMTQREGE